MAAPDDLPLPPSLQMPLRDLARGVAELAHRGEKVADGVIGILPATLQEPARNARQELNARASRMLGFSVTGGEVARAAAFLAGQSGDVAGFLNVLAHGWEYLRALHRNTTEMFSETIAATRLMVKGGPVAEEGAARAGRLFEVLRLSAAIGLPPGLPSRRSAAEQAEVDLNLCAVFVWLLAQRPKATSGEDDLLGLAAVLTAAHRAAMTAVADDAQAMAGLIADLALQL